MSNEYTPEKNPPMTRAQIGQALECAYIESSELEEVIDNVLVMLSKVRAESKAEALREAADDLFDWAKSPFMCLDECGNSNCPDDIRLGAGKDIQRWLRAHANQYKEQS